MLKQIIIAVTLAAVAAPVAAQNVYGSGGGPCSNWTANLKKRWPHLADTDWLMGYISGVKSGRGRNMPMLAPTNVTEATAFVTQFCATNPQYAIFEAADALVAQLRDQPPR